MKEPLILAIDQGTSSTKCIIFDSRGKVIAKAAEPLKTYYLEGGLVEQDPAAIYQNVLDAVKKCTGVFKQGGGHLSDISCCGISNQRETFVVWDKNGAPLHNALVWQCKRSVDICGQLKAEGLQALIKERTGLIIDPYFSGTKMVWLYRNNPQVRTAVDNGEAYFGTVDTWLLYKLTRGEQYLTDHTNASRTLFLNLETLDWDRDILNALGLSALNLPRIQPSSSFYAGSDFEGIFNKPVNITAMIGDSHAAAFGEGCFTSGTAKATLGTGCSIIMNIGSSATQSANGMVTTVCWSTEDRVDYAFEGVIVSCGATIEWIKNELGLFKDISETGAMANAVANNNGVYIIPAFSGLGAPYWQMDRKGEIYGLTFDCNKNHIARAALESIAYQVRDVIDAMQADAGIHLDELMVHGGITANKFVLHYLADLLRCHLICNDIADVSAKGAAMLAGLKAGIFADIKEIKSLYGQNSPVPKGQFAAITEKCYSEWGSRIGRAI